MLASPGAERDAALVAAMAEQLALDPPLLLWAACVSWRRDALVPRTTAELAAWLATHALAVLQWESGDNALPPPGTEGAIAEDHAERVAGVLQLGEMAAQLAASVGGELAETARLLGLLRGACSWLALAHPSSSGPAREVAALCWWAHPQTLAREPFRAAHEIVLRAESLLLGATADESLAPHPERCRRLAAEGRRHWLAAARGWADCLPQLAAKLGRLQLLESRFAEALEREKLEAMAEFAAGAGHEINNPLTVIAGRAQLFLRQETDPERRRALALVNTQAMRVYEMIADMRLFARPPEPQREPTDLVALVDRVVREISVRAAEQETLVYRRGDSGPVVVDVDPTQWSVALGALCHNALDALARQGHLEISVRRAGRHVEMHVADDGPGIKPEERRHLFDPFYSARQAGRGLGMGLAKCWRIVTNHGGRIEVRSEPGHGTVFVITIEQGSGTSDQAPGER
jgi:signal transduction histidine kinase